MALLEVSNLGIAFGGLQAVAQLDLSIEKGHLYGLIGPNGAGKTTVFNMLTGVYKPTEGNIILDGKDITGQNPELISKSGIARTFQNIRLFNDMTVLDNVKVGLHNQIRYNMWTGILRLPAYKEKEHEMNREAMKLLMDYPWPGNVRQLKNAIYRALTQLEGGELRPQDIVLPDFDAEVTIGEEALNGSLDDISKRFERSVLTRLYRTYPSTRKLAKRLGVSHTAIANKLREYGLSSRRGETGDSDE